MVRTTFHGVQPLSNPTYEDLDEIGRCLHFDDFEEALAKGYLVPQRLTNSHKRLNKLVLWFAPCQSMSTHNYYGNATFVVKWETVLEKLGPNLYLIDQAIYNSRSYTRIVLTSTNYDRRLKKVNLDSDNSALIRWEAGFQHVTHCLNNERFGPHELQIAIEVNERGARWLLRECELLANDHSLANTPFTGYMPKKGKGGAFESYKCYKFNTAQNMECEYAFCAENSRKYISARIIEKINSMPFAPSSTPEESLTVTFRRLLTLIEEKKKMNKLSSSRAKAKTRSSGSPSVTTMDACAAGLERLSLNTGATRAKSSRNPPVAQSQAHSLVAKSSRNPPVAQSQAHSLVAKSSRHPPVAQSQAHSLVAKSARNPPVAQSQAHSLGAKSAGHLLAAKSFGDSRVTKSLAHSFVFESHEHSRVVNSFEHSFLSSRHSLAARSQGRSSVANSRGIYFVHKSSGHSPVDKSSRHSPFVVGVPSWLSVVTSLYYQSVFASSSRDVDYFNSNHIG